MLNRRMMRLNFRITLLNCRIMRLSFRIMVRNRRIIVLNRTMNRVANLQKNIIFGVEGLPLWSLKTPKNSKREPLEKVYG